MIPRIAQITLAPRRLNERLWELHRNCAERTATPLELIELEAMCGALETGQDNQEEAE